MDKTKGELLQEELLFKQENGTTRLSDEEIDKAYAFAEDYKKFILLIDKIEPFPLCGDFSLAESFSFREKRHLSAPHPARTRQRSKF